MIDTAALAHVAGTRPALRESVARRARAYGRIGRESSAGAVSPLSR
jgi:hypothetical protein